jgi:hypothetical protein
VVSLYPPYRDARFENKYPVSESVSRLSARVKKRSSLSIPFTEAGVFGTVKPGEVSLFYVKPWSWYSRMITFTGSFTEKNGSAVLSGRFELSGYRVIMNLLLVATIFFFLFPFISNMSESLRESFFAIPASMLIVWIVSVLMGWRCWHLRKIEIEYISRTINGAFS